MVIRGGRNERKRNEKKIKAKTKINKTPSASRQKTNKHKKMRKMRKKETSIYAYITPQTNQHIKITKGKKNRNRIISAEVVRTIGYRMMITACARLPICPFLLGLCTS